MLPTTVQAVSAMLRADPSITPEARTAILSSIKNHGQTTGRTDAAPAARVLKRAEVAARLGCCARTVDGLSRSGALRRVLLPGRKRGAGYIEADIVRLIEAAAVHGEVAQ